MKNPTWSYSSIKLFETCAKKYHHLRVLKDYVEPEGEAARYGTEFHSAAEHYVRSGTALPERFSFAEPVLRSLAALPGEKFCEQRLGLREDLTACDFFAPDVWWRGVIDLLVIDGTEAKVVDYKTGSNTKYADKGQLELMALAVFAHHPQVTVVKGGLLFVICNAFLKETYTVDRSEELWAKWDAKYDRLLGAHLSGTWNPNPSGLCRRFCVVTECVHNGANR